MITSILVLLGLAYLIGKEVHKDIKYGGSAVLPASGGATTLDGLTDVDADSPSDGDVLTFVTSSGKWENLAPGGGGGTTTIGTQRVWTDVFTVTRSDNDTITYTAASAELATVIANSLIGRLARWTDAAGTAIRKGFVKNATASTTTVTIELGGDIFDTTDTNFRVSMYETVKVADWYIPGEQVADSANPVGKRYWNHTGQDWVILATSGYVGTAAAGTSADLTYDIYDDGTGIFTTDPSFSTNASVLNSLPNNRVITGGSQLTLRTPVAGGATNKAADLYVMAFYAFDDFWDAV